MWTSAGKRLDLIKIRKYITKVKITMKTSLIVIEAETEVKNAEKWCVRYIITLHYKEISKG